MNRARFLRAGVAGALAPLLARSPIAESAGEPWVVEQSSTSPDGSRRIEVQIRGDVRDLAGAITRAQARSAISLPSLAT